MPTHDFKNAGDILDFQVLKGTIVTIDSATDTCTVTVDGVVLTALLFYHCEPGSLARENGAITGAASGFAVDDEVIVMKRYDNSSIKVIGHTDGARHCGEDLIYVYTNTKCYVWDKVTNAPYSKVEYNDSTELIPHYVTSNEWPVLHSSISEWLLTKLNNAPSQDSIFVNELEGTHLDRAAPPEVGQESWSGTWPALFPLQTWLPDDTYARVSGIPYDLKRTTSDLNQPSPFHSRQYTYASRFTEMTGVRRWDYCIGYKHDWIESYYPSISGWEYNYKIYNPYCGEQTIWMELNQIGVSNEGADYSDYVSFVKHWHFSIASDKRMVAVEVFKWTPSHEEPIGTVSYGTDQFNIWASYKTVEDTSVGDPVEILKTVGRKTNFENAIVALIRSEGARYEGNFSVIII